MSSPDSRKTPKNPQRHARILHIAEQLFSKHGYHGVSIEMIAREAGMSKVTVYAYFHDKEDLFQQAAESVCDRISQAIERALDIDGDPMEKTIAMLQTKDEMIYDIVRSSPHANELLAARDLLVKEYFEQFNRNNERILTRLLKKMDRTKLLAPPSHLAGLLIQTSRGLTQAATNQAQLKRDIALVIGKLLD